MVVLCIGAGIAAVGHPHGAARMTGMAFAQHYGRLTSLCALLIFYQCRRMGILPGLRKPVPVEDVSAVFSGGPSLPSNQPAVPVHPSYQTAAQLPAAPAYAPREPRDAGPISDEQHAMQTIRRLRRNAAAA